MHIMSMAGKIISIIKWTKERQPMGGMKCSAGSNKGLLFASVRCECMY